MRLLSQTYAYIHTHEHKYTIYLPARSTRWTLLTVSLGRLLWYWAWSKAVKKAVYSMRYTYTNVVHPAQQPCPPAPPIPSPKHTFNIMIKPCKPHNRSGICGRVTLGQEWARGWRHLYTTYLRELDGKDGMWSTAGIVHLSGCCSPEAQIRPWA